MLSEPIQTHSFTQQSTYVINFLQIPITKLKLRLKVVRTLMLSYLDFIYVAFTIQKHHTTLLPQV